MRNDGYVVDVPYPLHFYKEMQPAWLNTVLAMLGCSAPDITRPYTYCELGCGGGINLLVAAACNPLGHFVGVDFNPLHIAKAREVQAQVGLKNIEFVEGSFQDFAQRDHGLFDYVVCNGAWSWLPSNAKSDVLKILYEHLHPEGVLYLQYMCFPGAARLTALQKVLYEVSLASGDSSAISVVQGLRLLRQLANAGAGLFVDNPEIEKELAQLEQAQPEYLAHDFLTEHWKPEHSVDMHRMLGQLGLSYVGSANCLENMDVVSIPGAVQPLLATAGSRALKETLRDMARNQSQRTDIYQKQPTPLKGDLHLRQLDRVTFAATGRMPAPGAQVFETPIGRIPGPEALLAPVMHMLLQGKQSFERLRSVPIYSQQPGLLLQTMSMLMWAEYVLPERPEAQPAPCAPQLQAWIDQQQLPLVLDAACGNAWLSKGR